MSTPTPTKPVCLNEPLQLVVGTRIHLGKQSKPPDQNKLASTISSFINLSTSAKAMRAAIAVDPSEKIPGYDLVAAIEMAVQDYYKSKCQMNEDDNDGENENGCSCEVDVLPVTPWGNFIPALNALTMWGINSTKGAATRILFVSAETNISSTSIADLYERVDLKDTLVAGVALPGHDYKGNSDSGTGAVVELNGRTSPWNTCAIWNLSKLALVGFPLVGEGLHYNDDGSIVAGGIEEAATIFIHQQLNKESNKAKLVKIDGVQWEQTFEDEERRKWHENKMASKLTRAQKHKDLISGNNSKLKGWVEHC